MTMPLSSMSDAVLRRGEAHVDVEQRGREECEAAAVPRCRGVALPMAGMTGRFRIAATRYVDRNRLRRRG